MADVIFEMRICSGCGLRYPLEKDSKFGVRCPHCLGATQVVSQKVIHEEEKIRAKSKNTNGREVAVLLDNIRSAWNVGSILRSADGLGVEQVFLCGISPTPENEAVRKTSLGAENSLQWSYHKNAVELIKNLKHQGWQVWALEETSNSKQVSSMSKQMSLLTHKKVVLILGSEVTGVEEELLSLSDEIFSIEMYGEKRSLNVAIAFSIAAYELSKNHATL